MSVPHAIPVVAETRYWLRVSEAQLRDLARGKVPPMVQAMALRDLHFDVLVLQRNAEKPVQTVKGKSR